MRVVAYGDRDWADRATIRTRLEALPHGTLVIHGAARGADTIAGEEAARIGHTVKAFPAEWDRYGRPAGPIRNRQMLAFLLEGEPSEERLVLAFHDDLSRSKGTADMVKIARKAKIEVEVIRSAGD